MSYADSIIQNAINNAANQIGNMGVAQANLLNFSASLLSRAPILLPQFNTGQIQTPGAVAVGSAPDFFASYADYGSIGLADDYQALMETKYNTLDWTTKVEVDAGITLFRNAHCGPYAERLEQLSLLLSDGAQDNVVSPSVRAMWLNEMEQGLERDRQAEFAQVANASAFGAELPPPSREAALLDVTQRFNDRLAQARTSVAVKTFEISLAYKQFCLGQMQQLTDAFRSAMLQYAGIQAGLLSHAAKTAEAIANKGLETRESEIKGFEDRRAAALTLYEAVAKSWTIRLEKWKTELMGRLDSAKLDYLKMQNQVALAEIPFKGQLEVNLEKAKLDVTALTTAMHAYEVMFAGFADVAKAAESGINGIGVATLQE